MQWVNELIWLAFLSMPSVGFFFSTCACCGGSASCPTIFTDLFDRADSTNIGGDWTEVVGDWQILSNQLRISTANAIALCATTGNAGLHRVDVALKSSATGDQLRVLVNYTDTSNYDFAEVELGSSTGTVKLYSRVGGANTQLGDTYDMTGAVANATIAFSLNATGGMLQAVWTISGTSGSYAAYTPNSGTGTALATGGTITGNADFNSFVLYNDSSTGNGCSPRCDSCIQRRSVSEYEIVIAGITNDGCSTCADVNGTYIVELFYDDVTGGIGAGSGGVCEGVALLAVPSLTCSGLCNGSLGGISMHLETLIPNISQVRVQLSIGGSLGSIGNGVQGIEWKKTYAGGIDETTDGHGSCLFNNLQIPLDNFTSPSCGILPTLVGTHCNVSAATCYVSAL